MSGKSGRTLGIVNPSCLGKVVSLGSSASCMGSAACYLSGRNSTSFLGVSAHCLGIIIWVRTVYNLPAWEELTIFMILTAWGNSASSLVVSADCLGSSTACLGNSTACWGTATCLGGTVLAPWELALTTTHLGQPNSLHTFSQVLSMLIELLRTHIRHSFVVHPETRWSLAVGWMKACLQQPICCSRELPTT